METYTTWRIELAGHSNQANGPFEFEEKPVFDQVQTEDDSIWYDQTDSLCYMVSHAIVKPELLLLSSANDKNWVQSANPIFM